MEGACDRRATTAFARLKWHSKATGNAVRTANMNWTGGTLQRTRHANKGVIQKQKAYFARARAKLQQSPEAATTPFHPEFLQDGGVYGLGRRISSSASGSVSHARHSARKRRVRDEHHNSPTARGWRRANDLRLQGASPHFEQDRYRGEVDKEKQRDQGKREPPPDTETQLLEANKKRLLRQQDWIGIELSKPVDLRCLSTTETIAIGKRRKPDAKTREVARRASPVTFVHPSGRDELDDGGNALMSGALPRLAAGDIRVRIGSDALTTAASMQLIDYASSQTDSDPMLFDEEFDGAVRREILEPSQGGPSLGRRLAANPRSTVDRNCSPQHGPPAYHNLTISPAMHVDECMRHTAADPNALDRFVQPSEATDQSYRLTHRAGSIERPFKLTFGRRPPHLDHTASATKNSSETQRVHANFNAEATETGKVPRNVERSLQDVVKRHTNPPSRDGDEPWRPYLDTGTSSSDHNDDWTAINQPHAPARNARAELSSCPQRTTPVNLTHVNLLTVPASLPSRIRSNAHLPDARTILRAGADKGFGNDEAFWQSCALGADPQSTMETVRSPDETSENSTSRATKGYASTRLPQSTAVTSVSSTPFPSTPFRSLSGQASRISDGVQYTPHSGSRSISSAALSYTVWGGAEPPHGEDVPGEGQGGETSAGSQFCELVTYASFRNHASHVDEVISDTRTSRSDLDQRSRAQDDVSRLAQASGSTIWSREDQASSMRNMTDSDDVGIDLVDPERLA
ncbi:hypothetical protein C7974DRAFT_199539 [Boeremia exigua]|uniref:uncharacterized protein n=1 Tax=Boeremia exigua TaxID=749465 RepID=UPI001E8CAE75|nr:uncharacterized protein C7974DRAFT_199539 [Boeremia exigua]KAH6625351.1 hypothetical protein C7974DRAFT_199539 [Boeremia exigua]